MRMLILFLLSCSCLKAAMFQPWTDNGEIKAINHASVDRITNDITISFWTAKSAGSAGGFIIAKPNGTGQFALRDGGGGTMDWDSDNKVGGTALWRSTAVFDKTNILTFFAVTFTYTDTNSFKFYSNGVVMAGSWINTPTNSAGTDGSFATYICSGSAGGRWLGYYSEVAVWNSILNPVQIQTLYRSRLKGIQRQVNGSTLKSYFPLDTWPDGKQHLPATIYPDRATSLNFPATPLVPGVHSAYGMAERVCSYPPNE